MLHRGLIVLLTVVWFASGCRQKVIRERETQHAGATVPADQGRVPALTSNEVIRIATETMKTNSFSLDGYQCKTVAFGGDSLDLNISNKWIVRFAPRMETPDSDVFVIIDDGTRRANLWAWRSPQKRDASAGGDH